MRAPVFLFLAACLVDHGVSLRTDQEGTEPGEVDEFDHADVIPLEGMTPEEEDYLWQPVTPLSPKLSQEMETADAAQSLMEKQCWTPGKKLGEGANGEIFLVTRGGERGALKFTDRYSYETEMAVMKSAKHCKGVLTYLDDNPSICGRKVTGKAYVMPLMDGDLDKFFGGKAGAQSCTNVIDAIYQGLQCLHNAGYIHGDLKPDNVFYRGKTGACPDGVVLADFGLAESIGTHTPQYGGKDFMGCNHLPSVQFNADNDPTQLGQSYVAGTIDYCSLGIMTYEFFRAELSIQAPPGWDGECGMMGHRRKHETRVRLKK